MCHHINKNNSIVFTRLCHLIINKVKKEKKNINILYFPVSYPFLILRLMLLEECR